MERSESVRIRLIFSHSYDSEVDEAVNQALAMIDSGNRIGGESIVVDLLKTPPDLHTVQFAITIETSAARPGYGATDSRSKFGFSFRH